MQVDELWGIFGNCLMRHECCSRVRDLAQCENAEQCHKVNSEYYYVRDRAEETHGQCLLQEQCHRVNTDFFAVRPRHVPRQAFANWSHAENAEWQATAVFQHITLAKGRAFWMIPFGSHAGKCRCQGGGLWHVSRLSCSDLQHFHPWTGKRGTNKASNR